MTNEELVKRMRSQIGDDVQCIYDHEALFRIAADRIEQLVATNEALVKERDAAYALLSKIELSLAKISGFFFDTFPRKEIRAALKGTDHDG